MRASMASFVLVCLIQPASGQSINIDFGSPGSGPSSMYAAAGRAGVWNVLGVMPTNVRFPLMDRGGTVVAATIYNNGGSAMLDVDHPATIGEDERLMDDMFLSFNDPVDLCLFFEHLLPGDYDVIVYAMTPDDASLMSRVRVDFATPGPVMVGGDWPGTHQEGVTFARHRVTVSNGRINPHSGQFNGFFQSGINGLQLLRLAPCIGDANGDFDVNFADVTAILGSFGDTGAPGIQGDSNRDGVVNFADVTASLGAFGEAC